MKQCSCPDSHIWYGMALYLDASNRFYQKCPNCQGRIDTNEVFDKEACDRAYEQVTGKKP